MGVLCINQVLDLLLLCAECVPCTVALLLYTGVENECCASRGNSGLGRCCGRSASAEPRRRGSCCAYLAYVLSCCSDVSAALAGPFPLGTETWPLGAAPFCASGFSACACALLFAILAEVVGLG